MSAREMMSAHAQSTLLSMNALRKRGALCDVTLRVEDILFKAHRVVLAACSDYFCAMFTTDLAEKDKPLVDIQGLAASTMEILLDFVYTETILVTVENVQDLLPAACLLQVKGVKSMCCEFLSSQLDPSNCLGIRTFAETHGCPELRQEADRFSRDNFTEQVQHQEFRELCQSEVEALLKCDDILVDSEEPVFEAVLNWVKHDRKEREPSLPGLLQLVRMPLLSLDYIRNVVDSEPLIECSPPCRDLVDEARNFHLRPELRKTMQGPRTKARFCDNEDEVLLVIGGRLDSRQDSSSDLVEKYNPKTQQWTFLPRIAHGRSYHKVVALDHRVYVIGGNEGIRGWLSSVECLDQSAGENAVWQRVAPMNIVRSHASATTLEGKIYVAGGNAGGQILSSMERYDPELDQWAMLESMQSSRKGAGMVAHNGLIYCLGGRNCLCARNCLGGRNKMCLIVNSMEQYDHQTGVWTYMAPMPTARAGAGVAVLRDHIYVVGGSNNSGNVLGCAEVYNIQTDTWSSVASMSTPRSPVSAAILCGRLYTIAAMDNSLESYDPAMDTWEVESMPTQRYGAGVCVWLDARGKKRKRKSTN